MCIYATNAAACVDWLIWPICFELIYNFKLVYFCALIYILAGAGSHCVYTRVCACMCVRAHALA